EAEIRGQRISVNVRARLDCFADCGPQCRAANVWNMGGFDAALAAVIAALDDAKHGGFASPASAFDRALAAILVHVLGEAADESFVSLNLTDHLEERAGLHGKTDAMIHEP